MKQQDFIQRFCFATLLLSASLLSFAQQDTVKKQRQPNFYLCYAFSGLGSNGGSFQPTIRIRGISLVYTYEQNSYRKEKNKRIDTVCVREFRQSSIDSIVKIVRDLGDTAITKYNYCIMSGGIHFLSVATGADTTKFHLSNTFDYNALKIANILNEYLPQNKQLWADEKMIKDADDCWTGLMKIVEDNKKKKKKVVKKNGT